MGFHEKEFSTVTWMFNVRKNTVVGKKGRDMTGIELNKAVSTVTTPTQQVSSNAPAQESIRRTSEVKTDDTAKAKERHEAELENVVARSKDGDTVQVSDDGATELTESKDGIVVSEKENLAKDERVEYDFEIEKPEIPETEAPKPEVKTEITDTGAMEEESYARYTEEELEVSYQQGEISAYAFNIEMERREALREAAMGESEELNETMGTLEEEENRTQQTDFAIDTALESESTIDIDDRLEIINRNAEAQRTQARITEEEGRLWDYQLRA